MTRLERYHLLSYFGSGKPIPYFQVIQIGTLYIANPMTKVRHDIRITKRKKGRAFFQWEFQRMFNEALKKGLIKRVENDRIKKMRLDESYVITPEDWDYQITKKGDSCLRNEQIERSGDPFYYKGFDRTADNKYADNIRLKKDDK